MHHSAEVAVTDIDPTCVAAIAAGDLGSHPRATVRAYSPSALRTLARYADPAICIEVRRSAFDVRGRWQLAVASR
jgi:hypothetical protein